MIFIHIPFIIYCISQCSLKLEISLKSLSKENGKQFILDSTLLTSMLNLLKPNPMLNTKKLHSQFKSPGKQKNFTSEKCSKQVIYQAKPSPSFQMYKLFMNTLTNFSMILPESNSILNKALLQ